MALARDWVSKAQAVIDALGPPLDFDELVAMQGAGSVQRVVSLYAGGAVLTRHTAAAGDTLALYRRAHRRFLSAGQELFLALTLSVVDSIKKGALLLIDEPELYLHPNLEVQFVRLLQSLLDDFDAYAVIATHSMIIAREVPSNRINVLRLSKEGERDLIVVRPKFETFGADLSKIGNYVFDDVFLQSPHELWLTRLVEEHGSPEAVAAILGDRLSLESRLLLSAMSSD
jgi:ABC-type glutathione transport system ATPase component